MLYELAHIIKEKCSFMWNFIEWANSCIFSMIHRKGLKKINEAVGSTVPKPYKMRTASKKDVKRLLAFFSEQPKDAFHFFNPHGFDEPSIQSVIERASFLTFVLEEMHNYKEEIVGYAFMRCFVNGKSYRGYIVDSKHRGQGLGKVIGYGLNHVGDMLHLNMYKSISPQNPASLKVTQAVCDTEILKTLENGDYLIKCMSKSEIQQEYNNPNRGGVILGFPFNNLAIAPQNEWNYAA